MKLQLNLAVPQYETLATVLQNSFYTNSSILGVPAPLRAGPAPQMGLDGLDSVLEAKLPVVDI